MEGLPSYISGIISITIFYTLKIYRTSVFLNLCTMRKKNKCFWLASRSKNVAHTTLYGCLFFAKCYQFSLAPKPGSRNCIGSELRSTTTDRKGYSYRRQWRSGNWC